MENLTSCKASLHFVSASPAVVDEVDCSAEQGGLLHVVIDSVAGELLDVMIDHHYCSFKMMDGLQMFLSLVKKNSVNENIQLTRPLLLNT